MPTLSRTFEFYNPWITKNDHTTQPSITMPQMVDGKRPSAVLSLTSERQPAADYYRLGTRTHSVTYVIEGAFKGTCTMQATEHPNPGENDWFDLPETAVTYVGTETTGNAGISGGFSGAVSRPVKTDLREFSGKYSWLRVRLDIRQGTLQAVKLNF